MFTANTSHGTVEISFAKVTRHKHSKLHIRHYTFCFAACTDDDTLTALATSCASVNHADGDHFDKLTGRLVSLRKMTAMKMWTKEDRTAIWTAFDAYKKAEKDRKHREYILREHTRLFRNQS